jgi:hypothetical protein
VTWVNKCRSAQQLLIFIRLHLLASVVVIGWWRPASGQRQEPPESVNTQLGQVSETQWLLEARHPSWKQKTHAIVTWISFVDRQEYWVSFLNKNTLSLKFIRELQKQVLLLYGDLVNQNMEMSVLTKPRGQIKQ